MMARQPGRLADSDLPDEPELPDGSVSAKLDKRLGPGRLAGSGDSGPSQTDSESELPGRMCGPGTKLLPPSQ